MNKNFLSDRPISSLNEDKFQRYDFSKRIANTIVERENEDCIVIGIYGAWGEGKTSVINFIEAELKTKDGLVPIKFNPWRYNDESSLLKQFFQKIATAVDAKLKSKTEDVGALLKKYGKILSFDIPGVGNLGDAIASAGEALGEEDIEVLKERIGSILREAKSKIVIFIDDIDRLDKSEIHSIFRLVKLTADFSNTTYVLSFDEEMVSAAIGERFGDGNKDAGRNFLEKIIQVPLKIPIAQPDALKTFCLELLNKTLDAGQIKLDESEGRRFADQFFSNILGKIDTPRLAVRYSNSLSFSLPLLHQEANTVDLMLIEAIKTFYPHYYTFIYSYPEFFIESYSIAGQKKNGKVESVKKHLDVLSANNTSRQKACIEALLVELFPMLNDALNNHGHTSTSLDTWYRNKKIASPKYFNRYFSYAINKGELSDIVFNDFIKQVQDISTDEVAILITTLIAQSSPDNFLYKVRSVEEEFSWDDSIKVAKAISNISDVFPRSGADFFIFGSPYAQAAIFVYRVIKKHEDQIQQFNLAIELTNETNSISFVRELFKWFKSSQKQGERNLFTIEQHVQLAKTLVKRALKEAGEMALFEKFPNQSFFLRLWAEYDKEELLGYIRNILSFNKTKIFDLLNAFTPIIISSDRIGEYRSDVTEDSYNALKSMLGMEYLSEILNVAGIVDNQIIWVENGEGFQSDINVAGQFRFFLHKDSLVNNNAAEASDNG